MTLVDTGDDTQTGGRLKRVADISAASAFLLTYGDGVADVDITAFVAFHRAHGRLATVTAVQPLGRFGALQLEDEGTVLSRSPEKPAGDGAWVNGGFFVLEPGVLDYIAGDATSFEQEPLEGLARDGQLKAYRHRGFWQPVDVLRDKLLLEQSLAAPARRRGGSGDARGSPAHRRRPLRRSLRRPAGVGHQATPVQRFAGCALWLEPSGRRGRRLRSRAAHRPEPLRAGWPGRLGRARRRGRTRPRALAAAVAGSAPELVLHLAAQPIVRASYDDPHRTFATNVMGP